jgi:hypothetical protein
MLSLPAFLFIVGFIPSDEGAINMAYIWIWAMIGLGISSEIIFVMRMRTGFLKRHGVDTYIEFFRKTYNKEAREERKKRHIAQKAQGVAYSNKIDQIQKNIAKRK